MNPPLPSWAKESHTYPQLQPLPRASNPSIPLCPDQRSFVTVTETELLEFPINLAFFLSSQALGMAPQIPQPEPQEAP